MRSIGFAIKKNELNYCVFEGTNRKEAHIITVDKQYFRSTDNAEDLSLYFYNVFCELCKKYNPEKICYKVHLNSTLSQIPYMHFPLGVLHLVCKEKGIAANGRSTSWISASKNRKVVDFQSQYPDCKLKNEALQSAVIAWMEFDS